MPYPNFPVLPAMRVLLLSFVWPKESNQRKRHFFESLRAKKKLYAVDARATQLRGAGFSAYNELLLNYFKRVSICSLS